MNHSLKPSTVLLFFVILVFWVSESTASGQSTAAPLPSHPQNYVFFNLDRENIRKPEFYDQNIWAGAQLKYTWRELEKTKDNYDFSAIDADLAFLASKKKGLFLQIQDVSFNPSAKNVPAYIAQDPEYNGGADQQYEFSNDQDANAKPAGWVARRWDPGVARRFHKLLAELGRRYDSKIQGITLPESAVDFGSTGRYYPKGFTPAVYAQAIQDQMTAAKTAFRSAVVVQYANFMPGEWLPWDDKGYLSGLFAHAANIGAALGGPDILPYQKGHMNHTYRFATQYTTRLTLAYAVQEGNYSIQNVKTGKPMTVRDIYDFATRELGLDYIFWYPEEPYFTRDLVPFLKGLK